MPDTLVGQTVEALGRETGALIVAIWRGGQPIRCRAGDVLQADDTVLVAGAAAGGSVAGVQPT